MVRPSGQRRGRRIGRRRSILIPLSVSWAHGGVAAKGVTELAKPLYPALDQINIRVLLTDLSHRLRRSATLDDLPDAELDHLAGMGFDWI